MSPASTQSYTLSLHDALPILHRWSREVPEAAQKLAARFWPGPLTMVLPRSENVHDVVTGGQDTVAIRVPSHPIDRKSTRLNSSHLGISYAVFCLKKKI